MNFSASWAEDERQTVTVCPGEFDAVIELCPASMVTPGRRVVTPSGRLNRNRVLRFVDAVPITRNERHGIGTENSTTRSIAECNFRNRAGNSGDGELASAGLAPGSLNKD